MTDTSTDLGVLAGGHASTSAQSPDVDERIEPHRDDVIRCVLCRAVVTRAGLAVSQAGAHQHTFRNPAGYSWTLRCFSNADGCGAAGGLTTESTWFAGYEWCFAVCLGCGRHLGWWYVGSGHSFVGLISTRIS